MRRLSRAAVIALALMFMPGAAAAPEHPSTFGILADIHFDPSEPAPRRGRDTDKILFSSALSAVADRMASADFVIFAGDLLGHRFGGEAEAGPGGIHQRPRSAQDSAAFVIGALAKALPGKPVLVALGNNDSDCGDYAIMPGGDFLAATMEAVRAAAGPGHLTDAFERTYLSGGYYEARHPGVEKARILVLNDVLWSSNYRNSCGATGLEESRTQMDWLKARLAAAQAEGAVVWLVHHIPWGIDAYSTLHAQTGSCRSGITPFLREDVSAELYPLLRQHAGTIVASFSAHSHFDDFRLILDDAGKPVIADKMVPAISPLFGQDPAFQLFTYNAAHGRPVDYTSYHLNNLDALSTAEAGDWRERYVFTRLYSEEGYSPESVSQLPNKVEHQGPARDLYFERRTGVASDADVRTYACAVGHADVDGYARCRCSPSD